VPNINLTCASSTRHLSCYEKLFLKHEYNDYGNCLYILVVTLEDLYLFMHFLNQILQLRNKQFFFLIKSPFIYQEILL